MALALDYLAQKLTTSGALKIKSTERILLRNALYQVHYLTKLPLYSVVDESVKLANKYFHPRFGKFLNAMMRAYQDKMPKLPTGMDASSLTIRYSYPQYFVEQLINAYGLAKTVQILELGNMPAKVMARSRIDETGVITLDNAKQFNDIANSSDYYIQNATPAHLLKYLSRQTLWTPRTILDLCAAPGGKSIGILDLYVKAQLTANDPSESRLQTLRHNFAKYGISATVTCHRGEEYPTDKTYDLVILDVPCSNSGVLNKRPEARWRLTHEALENLGKLQQQLITHAKQLVAPGGQLWYLTCSILPSENHLPNGRTVLPNAEGWDGGYGSVWHNDANDPSNPF